VPVGRVGHEQVGDPVAVVVGGGGGERDAQPVAGHRGEGGPGARVGVERGHHRDVPDRRAVGRERGRADHEVVHAVAVYVPPGEDGRWHPRPRRGRAVGCEPGDRAVTHEVHLGDAVAIEVGDRLGVAVGVPVGGLVPVGHRGRAAGYEPGAVDLRRVGDDDEEVLLAVAVEIGDREQLDRAVLEAAAIHHEGVGHRGHGAGGVGRGVDGGLGGVGVVGGVDRGVAGLRRRRGVRGVGRIRGRQALLRRGVLGAWARVVRGLPAVVERVAADRGEEDERPQRESPAGGLTAGGHRRGKGDG
jgi:hypothetical protein